MRKIEVGLAAEIGAIGEEGEGGGVVRPDEVGFGARAVGRGRGDALALVEICKRRDANFAAGDPGQALAVGRNGDLGDGDRAPLAGRLWAEALGAGRGGLSANWREGGCAKEERQGGAA